MSKLYLECYSGISGDMTAGALLDLGADREKLEKVLATVPAEGFRVEISTVQKSAVNACDFDVILDVDNHDHDMEYLFGHEEHAQHHHEHDHDHHHHHDHDHEHDHHDHEHDHHEHDHHDHDHDHHHDHHDHDHHHHHDHVHRSLKDVLEIIQATEMTEEAREIASSIFTIVAEAEAEVHGKSIDEVHFHEVGAIDSIVDIISIAVLFDDLKTRENITDVIVPELYEGHGTVRCQHGILPIPVPAVTSIVRKNGIRVHMIPDEGEFVTPTGAAVVAALRTTDRLPESFIVKAAGLGAGKREYARAGFVRAMLLED